MEGRGLTVENEKKERGGMEGYVGKMAEGWGSDTCGCRKKKKDGMDGGMEVGESDVIPLCEGGFVTCRFVRWVY